MMIIIIVEVTRHLGHLDFLWKILLQKENRNEKLNGLFVMMSKTKKGG